VVWLLAVEPYLSEVKREKNELREAEGKWTVNRFGEHDSAEHERDYDSPCFRVGPMRDLQCTLNVRICTLLRDETVCELRREAESREREREVH
jgi:hypothetical protein